MKNMPPVWRLMLLDQSFQTYIRDRWELETERKRHAQTQASVLAGFQTVMLTPIVAIHKLLNLRWWKPDPPEVVWPFLIAVGCVAVSFVFLLSSFWGKRWGYPRQPMDLMLFAEHETRAGQKLQDSSNLAVDQGWYHMAQACQNAAELNKVTAGRLLWCLWLLSAAFGSFLIGLVIHGILNL